MGVNFTFEIWREIYKRKIQDFGNYLKTLFKICNQRISNLREKFVFFCLQNEFLRRKNNFMAFHEFLAQ